MTAQTIQKESGTDEEFFRYHLRRHGMDRSLSSLWLLFNATPLPLLGTGTDDL